MKKLTAMIGVLTALFILTAVMQPVMGSGIMSGFVTDSYDGEAKMVGSTLYVHASTGAVSINDGAGFSDSGDGYGDFSYDATGGPPRGWDPAPPGMGEQVYFIAENPSGYVWAAQREVTDLTNCPIEISDLVGQFEKIPTPEMTPGSGVIDLQIESPAYTDYSYLTSGSIIGTYELFAGYRVYVEADDDPGNWVLVGDTTPVAGTYDNPIEPNLLDHQETDPSTVVTGMNEIQFTTGSANYRFRVAMLFDLDTQGIYETNVFGEPTDWTDDPVSEFGPGMLIPVVAIVGMFVAFSVYRRKKEE